MRKLLTFYVLAVVYIKCVVSGEECTSYENQAGECKLNRECDTIPFLKDVHRTIQQTQILRELGCGFEGATQKICCPLPKNNKKCELLNGIKGECKDIVGCTVIHKLPVNEIFNTFTSSCDADTDVCCPTSIPVPYGPSIQPTASNPRVFRITPAPTPTPISINSPTTLIISTPSAISAPTSAPVSSPTSSLPVLGKCELTSLPPDPSTGCCGLHSTFRIPGENKTGLDEYPWLALLEYRDTKVGTIVTNCGGSLISGRYVLTAAQCVHPSLTTVTPESVRLGEHDISSDVECETMFDLRYCNHDTTSVPIERIIVQTLYNPRNHENDIALVRLSRTVNYSDYIKPICLPSHSTSDSGNLHAAGWGITSHGYTSSVKIHITVPYVNVTACKKKYPRIKFSHRICAGGQLQKGVCGSDRGGPLMQSKENRFEIQGVLSLGQSYCHLGKPAIYTNVADFLAWIRIQMT